MWEAILRDAQQPVLPTSQDFTKDDVFLNIYANQLAYSKALTAGPGGLWYSWFEASKFLKINLFIKG